MNDLEISSSPGLSALPERKNSPETQRCSYSNYTDGEKERGERAKIREHKYSPIGEKVISSQKY